MCNRNAMTAESETFIENDDEVFKKFHHEVAKFGERKLRSSFCSKCGRFALSVEYLLEEEQLGVYIYDFKVMKLYEYGRFPEKHFASGTWTYWYGDAVVVIGTKKKYSVCAVTAQYLIELDHEKRVGRAVYTREYTFFWYLSFDIKQHCRYSAEVQNNGKSYSFVSHGGALSFFLLFPRCPWDTSAKLGMTQNFMFMVRKGNAYFFANRKSVVLDGRLFNQNIIKEINGQEICIADSFAEIDLSIICKNIELGNDATDIVFEPTQGIRQLDELTEEERTLTGVKRFYIYEHEQILMALDKSGTEVQSCFVFNAKDWALEKIRSPLESSDMISRHSSGILLKWSYDEEDRLTVEKLTNQRRQLRSLQDICRQKLIGDIEQIEVIQNYEQMVFRK